MTPPWGPRAEAVQYLAQNERQMRVVGEKKFEDLTAVGFGEFLYKAPYRRRPGEVMRKAPRDLVWLYDQFTTQELARLVADDTQRAAVLAVLRLAPLHERV